MKIKTSATLSKEEVAQIITEALQKKGFSVENLAFKMSLGYSLNEGYERIFEGVTFDTELVKN